MLDGIIVAIILAYAGWNVFRFYKSSRQPGCSGCSGKGACPASCKSKKEI